MKKGAVIMTALAVACCISLLAVLSVAAPWLAGWFANFRGLSDGVRTVILIAYYICAIPAFVALICLMRILENIRRDQPFKRSNTRLMAVVSFCCMAVTVVTLWAGFYYMPLWFISAAMFFVFLIVRVVRGCFIAAVHLKEENSLTI